MQIDTLLINVFALELVTVWKVFQNKAFIDFQVLHPDSPLSSVRVLLVVVEPHGQHFRSIDHYLLCTIDLSYTHQLMLIVSTFGFVIFIGAERCHSSVSYREDIVICYLIGGTLMLSWSVLQRCMNDSNVRYHVNWKILSVLWFHSSALIDSTFDRLSTISHLAKFFV